LNVRIAIGTNIACGARLMTVHLYDFGLSYFAVPKVACTSIKTALFKVENGFDFREFKANGRNKYIHDSAYQTLNFDQQDLAKIANHVKFAVVRDPVERVVSCYNNRVITYRELSEKYISKAVIEKGLRPNPSLEEFVDNIEAYRHESYSIRHHTDELAKFLGTDRLFFSEIFSFRDLDRFALECSKITGQPVVLGRLQVSKSRYKVKDLPTERVNFLRDIYRNDYEIFGEWL
jgi:hypothetical protein